MKGTLVEFVETYIKFHYLVKPTCIIFPLKEQKCQYSTSNFSLSCRTLDCTREIRWEPQKYAILSGSLTFNIGFSLDDGQKTDVKKYFNMTCTKCSFMKVICFVVLL